MTVKEFVDKAIRLGAKPNYRIIINGSVDSYILLINNKLSRVYDVPDNKLFTLMSFTSFIAKNNADEYKMYMVAIGQNVLPIIGIYIDNKYHIVICCC